MAIEADFLLSSLLLTSHSKWEHHSLTYIHTYIHTYKRGRIKSTSPSPHLSAVSRTCIFLTIISSSSPRAAADVVLASSTAVCDRALSAANLAAVHSALADCSRSSALHKSSSSLTARSARARHSVRLAVSSARGTIACRIAKFIFSASILQLSMISLQ